MRAGFWLAGREVSERWPALVLAAVVVSLVTAFCAAMELMWRSEESGVARRIDRMGPAVRLVPRGRTAVDLARFELGEGTFSGEEVAALRKDLSGLVREVEGRLLLRLEVRGRRTNVVGTGRRLEPAAGPLGPAEAASGSLLAERLGVEPGDTVRVDGHAFRLAAVMPLSGGPEDDALFVPLESLRRIAGQHDGVNELRFYTRPGASIEGLVSHLARAHPEAGVVVPERGGTAEQELGRTLGTHRRAVYVTMAVMVAFIVLVWSHLGADERRIETATLAALGCPWTTILLARTIQTAGIGAAGAAAGYAMAVVAVWAQGGDPAARVLWSAAAFYPLIAGCVFASAIGALPGTVLSALTDQAAALQEDA